MNKSCIFAVLAISMTALAVSCQKNSVEEPKIAPVSRTFTCIIADPAMKVALTDAGKTTWEVGDEILVHGAGSSNRVVVRLTAEDISANGKQATITVEGVEPYDRSDKGYTSTYYASYPASATPAGNFYYNSRFDDTNHLLMAAYNVDDTFVFHNLCGVISFKVSGDFDNYVFSGNNGETVAYDVFQSRLTMTTGGPLLEYQRNGDGVTSTALTSVSGMLDADGKTTWYVCLPNGADFSAGFTFKFKDGADLVKIATTKTPVHVARGTLLPLGDITARLKDYVPPTESDHKSEIPTEGAIDLSVNGSANSYIIRESGIYKFPAVKGNSEESAGNVFGATLLWETANGTESISAGSIVEAVDFEDNWIYFQMPQTIKPGNAVIAAKDAQDRIIWSWHIWVPATAITSEKYSLATAPLMDRYLGALDAATTGVSNASTLGLVYQWGRKDPFPGPGSLDSSSAAAVAGTMATVSRGAVSIAQSISAPTVMATVDNDNWSTASDSDLWSKNGEKTQYDPCPPGYKVPAMSDAPSFFCADLSTIEGWTANPDNMWFAIGNPATIFPMGGYIDDYSTSYSFAKVGQRVAVWAADAGSASKGQAVDVRFDSARHQLASPAKSRGAYVRCIVDTDETEPFENAEGTPVMGTYEKILVGDATELSGLCLSKDGSFLWGVGDQGTLYKIAVDGTVTPHWSHDADMEGVTIHPTSGDLYVAIEGSQKVYHIPAPDYNSYETILYVQEAIDGEYGNSGLEGISYYKDDILYVGSQYGATLWQYGLDGTKIAKKLLTTIAPGISEVAGIFYDDVNDWLWITDSEVAKIFLFKGDASSLLAIYDVPFIGNAESICVDSKRGCVWVGSDDSTSKIYKIAFSGL